MNALGESDAAGPRLREQLGDAVEVRGDHQAAAGERRHAQEVATGKRGVAMAYSSPRGRPPGVVVVVGDECAARCTAWRMRR